jgi:hypothetical protein
MYGSKYRTGWNIFIESKKCQLQLIWNFIRKHNFIRYFSLFYYRNISYRHVYNYCTNTQSQGFTAKATPKVGANNRNAAVQDGANIVGGELYTKLKNHLKVYLEKICEVRSFVQEISLLIGIDIPCWREL